MNEIKEIPCLSNITHIKEIRIFVEDISGTGVQTSLFLEAYAQEKEIDIWPLYDKGFKTINVKFIGVSNFNFSKISSGLHNILGFSAIDISDRNWENINYEIEDYENGTISFFCEEINVLKETDPIYFL